MYTINLNERWLFCNLIFFMVFLKKNSLFYNSGFFYCPLSLALRARAGLARRFLLSGATWSGMYSFFSWRWPISADSARKTSLNFKTVEVNRVVNKKKVISADFISSVTEDTLFLRLKAKVKILRAGAVFFRFNRYWQIYKSVDAIDAAASIIPFIFVPSGTGFFIWRFKLFNPRSLQHKYKITFPYYRSYDLFCLRYYSFFLKFLSFFFPYVFFFVCLNCFFFGAILLYGFFVGLPLTFFTASMFGVKPLAGNFVYFWFACANYYFIPILSFLDILILTRIFSDLTLLLPVICVEFLNVAFYPMLENSCKLSIFHSEILLYFLAIVKQEALLHYFFIPSIFFLNPDLWATFDLKFLGYMSALLSNTHISNFTSSLNILSQYVVSFELALPPLMFFNSMHLVVQVFEKLAVSLIADGLLAAFIYLYILLLLFILIIIIVLFMRYVYFRYDPWSTIFLWVYSRDQDFLLLNTEPLGVFSTKNNRIGVEISSYLDPLSLSFNRKLNTLYLKEFEETFYGYSGFIKFGQSNDILFNTTTFLQKFRSNPSLLGKLSDFWGFIGATGYSLINVFPNKNLKLASSFTNLLKHSYKSIKRYVFFESYGSKKALVGQTFLTALLEDIIEWFPFLAKVSLLNSRFKILNARKFTLNFLKEKTEGLIFSPVDSLSDANLLSDHKLLLGSTKLSIKGSQLISRLFKPALSSRSRNKIFKFGLESFSDLSLHELELNHYQLSYDLDKHVTGKHIKTFKFGLFERLNEFSFWRRELNDDLHVEYPFWYQDFRGEQLTSITLPNLKEVGFADQSLKMVGAVGYEEEEDVVSEYLSEEASLLDYSSTATLDWEGPITDYGLLSEKDEDDTEDFFDYKYRLIDFTSQEYNKHLWRQTWLGIPAPRSSKIFNAQDFSSILENKEDSVDIPWRSFERSYSRNTDYTQDVNVTDYSGDYTPWGKDYNAYTEGLFSTFYDDLILAYYANFNLAGPSVFCISVYDRLFTTFDGTYSNIVVIPKKTSFYSTRKNLFSRAHSVNYHGFRFLKFFKQNAFREYVAKFTDWRPPFLLLFYSFFLFFCVFLFLFLSLLSKNLIISQVVFDSSGVMKLFLLFLIIFISLLIPLFFFFKRVLITHLVFTGCAFNIFSFSLFSLFLLNSFMLWPQLKTRLSAYWVNFCAINKPATFVVEVAFTSHYASTFCFNIEGTSIFLIRFSDFITNYSLSLFDNSTYNLTSVNLNPYTFFLKFNLLSEQIMESYTFSVFTSFKTSFGLPSKLLSLRAQTSPSPHYLKTKLLSAPTLWNLFSQRESKFGYALSLGNFFDFYYYITPFCKSKFIALTFLTAEPPDLLGIYSWKFFSIKSSLTRFYRGNNFLSDFAVFLQGNKLSPEFLGFFSGVNQNTDWNPELFFFKRRVKRSKTPTLSIKLDSNNSLSKLFYGLLDHPTLFKNVFKLTSTVTDDFNTYFLKPPVGSNLQRPIRLNSEQFYSDKTLCYLRLNSYTTKYNFWDKSFPTKILGGLVASPVSFTYNNFLDGVGPFSFEAQKSSFTPVSLPSLGSIYDDALSRSFSEILTTSTTQARLSDFLKYEEVGSVLLHDFHTYSSYDEQIFYNKFFVDQTNLKFCIKPTTFYTYLK